MRTTARLAAEIARMRAERPKRPYRDICEALAIVGQGGAPDPGMAKLIEAGYEPRRASTRARLGLEEARVCPMCKRRRRQSKPRPSRVVTPAETWFRALPRVVRLNIIMDAYRVRE